jgi:hypothetical protein
MVHLAIEFSTVHATLNFRVVQVDQFPDQAAKAGVRSTPTLILPGRIPLAGNLPAPHFAYHLWLCGRQDDPLGP